VLHKEDCETQGGVLWSGAVSQYVEIINKLFLGTLKDCRIKQKHCRQAALIFVEIFIR
jgi:hypothetical protein